MNSGAKPVKRSKPELDLALLRTQERGSVFGVLRPGIAKPYKLHCPKTALWLHGALYLNSLVGWSVKDDMLPPLPERLARSTAAFRGFLAEFARVDHAVARDFRQAGIDGVPNLLSSPDPRFHLLRELRNIELHLSPSEMASHEAEFQFGSGKATENVTLELLTVEDLTVERLRKLDNAKHYTSQELQAMVDWFEQNQRSWGVVDTCKFVAEEFARFVYASYTPFLGLSNEMETT